MTQTPFRVFNIILAILGTYLLSIPLGWTAAIGFLALAVYTRVKVPQTFREYYGEPRK